MKPRKLELTWIGKDERPRLEPRILLEDPERSYAAAERVSSGDIFDNRLIFGDNLLALKALEAEFAGKVKCIFIDPPYNTGSAFTHYDDGLEHSLWLTMMRDRLEMLRRLLSEDGSIWIALDDREGHYFKVICDEVFGRQNFRFTFIWRNVDSPNDNKVPVTSNHNFIFCYARNASQLRLRPLEDPAIVDGYPILDEAANRRARDRLLKKNGRNSLREDRPTMYFRVTDPDGNDVYPIHDDGREARWACGPAKVEEHRLNGTLIWKQRDRNGELVWVPYTREFAPEHPTKPYPTIWSDLDTMRQTKAHLKSVLPGVPEFDTPKPEDLVARVIRMSTSAGDLVLDSFAGSGTTGAVAHKMGRRWIMVELGEHCHTHIIPRMQKVIDGTDQGGISKAQNWKGGGGFRYYRLAPSLIQEDKFGNPIINPDYNAEMLAEAVCKFMGFRYAPSQDHYWMHGQSTENDFIFVTTQTLTMAHLQYLNEAVGSERSLLICCMAHKGKANAWPNLTIKRIPQEVLGKCEFGQDDYSLKIANLPEKAVVQDNLFAEVEAEAQEVADE